MESLPLAEQFVESNYGRTPLGPSSRSCCKVTVRNVCGSGSVVGERDGKSLVLTNAHVAGSRPGTRVNCTFPFLDNKQVGGSIIMAAYSDRIMMDWAVLEMDELVALPVVKLSIEPIPQQMYTMGYPRCKGPYSQDLVLHEVTHSGTVAKWRGNSIGGQSGSGVHSDATDLQVALLTWSWGGYGAGQTTRSIWMQYVNKSAVGFIRPEGLIELCDNRAEDLEEGIFFQSNITELDIWDHLDDGDGDDDGNNDDQPPNSDCAEFAKSVAKIAGELATTAKRFGGDKPAPDGDKPATGPLYGL